MVPSNGAGADGLGVGEKDVTVMSQEGRGLAAI